MTRPARLVPPAGANPTTGAAALIEFRLHSRSIGPRTRDRTVLRHIIDLPAAGGRKGEVLQRLTRAAVLVGGSRALRPVGEWPLAVSPDEWAAIVVRIEPACEAAVLHIPPENHGGRRFGALLLASGGPRHYVRVDDAARVDKVRPEVRGARGGRSGAVWPVATGSFREAGLAVEVTGALPLGHHRPARLTSEVLGALCDDVADALDAPPASAPRHWRPAHGDLAAWNVRRTASGALVVLDWEDRAWLPPHADLVRYVTTSGRRPLAARIRQEHRPVELEEAVDHWLTHRHLATGEQDDRWTRKTLEAQRNRLVALLRPEDGGTIR